MEVTINVTVNTTTELAEVVKLFKELNLGTTKLQVVKVSDKQYSALIKGDKRIDPNSMKGMWAKSPRTIQEIRAKDWDRNFSI